MLGLEQHDQPRADAPLRGQGLAEFVRQLFGDEHDRAGLGDRVVEHVVEPSLGSGIGGARQPLVGAGCEAMGVDTRVTEPAENVTARQRGQSAEVAEPEPGEQVDQFRLRLTQGLQPTDRQPGTEAGGVAGGDEHRFVLADRQPRRDARREPAVGDADTSIRHAGTASAIVAIRRDANIASPPK